MWCRKRFFSITHMYSRYINRNAAIFIILIMWNKRDRCYTIEDNREKYTRCKFFLSVIFLNHNFSNWSSFSMYQLESVYQSNLSVYRYKKSSFSSSCSSFGGLFGPTLFFGPNDMTSPISFLVSNPWWQPLYLFLFLCMFFLSFALLRC